MDPGQSSQRFSPVNTLNLDDMDQFFGSQDYSTAQGSIGPSEPAEDESPVKWKTKKRRQQSKKTEKEKSESKIGSSMLTVHSRFAQFTSDENC